MMLLAKMKYVEEAAAWSSSPWLLIHCLVLFVGEKATHIIGNRY